MQNTNQHYNRDGDNFNSNANYNNEGTSAAKHFSQFDHEGVIRNNPLLDRGDNNYQGGPGNYMNGITPEMMNNNVRMTYGPITLSNGAIYTGDLLNGMKDGYGQ